MATLRGTGALKDVNLIVSNMRPCEIDGKVTGQWLDVQVDYSLLSPDKVLSGDKKADSNPHLTNQKVKGKDGGEFVSHTAFYSNEQVAKIKEAAGKKVVQAKFPGKEESYETYGIQANLMQNAKKQLIINTAKDMAPTKNPYFGKNILEKQAKVVEAARAFRDMSAENGKEVPVAEASKEVDEPSI